MVGKLIEAQAALDNKLLFVDAEEIGFFVLIKFVVNIADQLRHDIVHKDQSRGITKLIDDQSQLRSFLKEILKQVIQPHRSRNHLELATNLHEIGLFVLHQAHHILDVDQALGLIKVPRHERKAGVFGLNGKFQILLKTQFQIQNHDLAARSHDVLHRDIVQLESINKDLAFGLGHLLLALGLLDKKCQLFRAMNRFTL